MKEIVKKMVHLLDVPTYLVKEVVGLPLENCFLNSIEELKMAFIDADEDSEEWWVVGEKLRSLLVKEIKKNNLEKIKEIYFLAKELEFPDVEIIALRYWDDLALEEVEKAITDEELKVAFGKTPKTGNSRRIALEKKSQWALKDFDAAKNLAEAAKACKRAPKNSEAKRFIVKGIYDLYFKNEVKRI
jgi:hypothetical protein